MNDMKLHIVGTGVYTPAGDTIANVDQAIRADVRVAKPSRLVGVHGNPLMVAPMITHPSGVDHGIDRASLFAEGVIHNCFHGASRTPEGKTALIVAFTIRALAPEWDGIAKVVAKHLSRTYGVVIPRRLRSETETNAASVFLEIARAREMLIEGVVDNILLVALHSGCYPDQILLCEALYPDGHQEIPAEGAAMIWLSRNGPGPCIAAYSFATSKKHATAEDRAGTLLENFITSRNPARSPQQREAAKEGTRLLLDLSDPASLTTAMENALQQWQGDRRSIAETFVDLNGAAWRAKQWAIASTRVFAATSKSPALVAPAMCLGELGAVSVPLQMALAAHAVCKDGAPRMVISSGPASLRGAAIIAP